MTLELIRLLVGQAPPEYEPLEYIIASALSFLTVKVIYEMFYFVFNLIKGK